VYLQLLYNKESLGACAPLLRSNAKYKEKRILTNTQMAEVIFDSINPGTCETIYFDVEDDRGPECNNHRDKLRRLPIKVTISANKMSSPKIDDLNSKNLSREEE